MHYLKPHLELVLATRVLIPSCHKGTLPIKGVVKAVEGCVMGIPIALAHTVVAALRWDTPLTLTHQTRGTEAARDTGALLRTQAFIMKCLALLLALGTETVLVDLPRATLLV